MSADPPSRSVGDRVFEGTLWFLGLRLFSRVVGFIALAVKARVLTPQDFGVFGSIALVSGLVGILASHGVYDQLIRLPVLTMPDVHRAWTLNFLFSVAIAATFLGAAEPAAAFLNDPALVDVLRVCAIRPILDALASPVVVWWSRELRFRPLVLFAMATRLTEVVFSTLGALILRTYWGLIFGSLLAYALNTVLTHLIRPYLPRPRLDRSAAFLSFSGWSLLHGVTNYFAVMADEIAVRRTSDTVVFGLYHVSRDLSRIFVAEAVTPVTGPLLAGLSRLQPSGSARLLLAAAKAVAAAALIGSAVGFGLSATAAEAVALVLGGQWSGAVPFLRLLSVGTAAHAVSELHRSIMVAAGRVEVSALLWLGRAVVQLAASVGAVLAGGALAVAVAFTLGAAALLVLDYAVVFRVLGGPAATALAVLWRPVLAGPAMAGLLWAAPWPPGWGAFALAPAKVALGAVAYGLVVALAWRAAGRPEGGESVLLDRLPPRLRALADRLVGAPSRPAAGAPR